jgi:hypothetical protein
VTFSHSYDYPTQYYENSPINASIIYLQKVADNIYSGEGDIVWCLAGDTYLTEVIKNPIGHEILDNTLENYSSILAVSSMADTLTLQFTQNTAKLSWLIGSFSIIILQPVFEAILVKKDNNK